MKFDVVGLGFNPGKESKGPSEIFVEEMRDGKPQTWTDCRCMPPPATGPIYVLTADLDVCFSYDGNSLVPLSGYSDDCDEGELRVKALLRVAALRLPSDIEQHRMM